MSYHELLHSTTWTGLGTPLGYTRGEKWGRNEASKVDSLQFGALLGEGRGVT
jgi:hypothetical protein